MRRFLKRFAYTCLILFVVLNIMSAFRAYKFTHFYNNQNLQRLRPEEMSFGQKLNAVVFGVDYPKSIVVDSLHIPHQKLSIKTKDGLLLSAWYIDEQLDDTTGISKGTVIMFHGHASSKSGIIEEAEAFRRMDYNVLMIDFRAHGESEGNTCTIGYNESKDVEAAYDFIKSKGEKNIVLWGVSLGAATIMKAINDGDVKPSKVILEMPFASLKEAAEGRIRTMGLPQEPIATLLTFWGGTEQGFWAFSHRPDEYAKKITCPVLLQWGTNDQRVSANETNRIYENLASSKKTLVKYGSCGHESLYKKESEKWLMNVRRFLGR